MTITVVVFSLLAALILALLAAVIFSVVCIGFALIILFPVLFFTTAGASFIWLFGVGAYYILKWFNQKEIPGIHKGMGEGVGQDLGLDAITGAGEGSAPQANGSADGEAGEGKEEGPAGKVPGGKNLEGVGKSTGVDVNNANPKKAAEAGKGAAGKTGLPGT